jgi:hypothetical protein
MRNQPVSTRAVRIIVTLIIAVVGFVILMAFAQQHFYLFKRVEPGQMGVMVRGGQIYRIVPPACIQILACSSTCRPIQSQLTSSAFRIRN